MAQSTTVEAPAELQETFGERLARSLRYRGINQQDMAEYLSVHRNTVGSWCTDRNKIMPVILRAWAEHVDVPVQWFLTGEWPAPNTKAPAKKAAARKAVKA